MLAGIAALAAVLVAAAALALLLPLRLSLTAATDPVLLDLRVAPLGGLFGSVRLAGGAARRGALPVAWRRVPHRRAARHGFRIAQGLPQFAGALVARVRFDRLRIDVRFGTGDPATTGQIYGQMMPLAWGFGASPGADLRITPDFGRACLSGRAEVVLRVTPIRLAGPLLRLFRDGFGVPPWR